MIKPLDFINSLRNSDGYIKKIYTRGSCYQLYKVLKVIYPTAKAYKVKTDYMSNIYDHVVTKIRNKYYDINGVVNIKNYFEIAEVLDQDISELEKWSFFKNYCIGKICVNCGEIVTERDGHI